MGSRQYQHLAANAGTEAAAYGEYPVVKAGAYKPDFTREKISKLYLYGGRSCKQGT